MIKINLQKITFAITVCTLLFFFAKIATPILSEWLNQLLFGAKKKKNSNIDFDLLVEQKKSMLRGSDHDPSKNVQSTQRKKGSAFEARVAERFQELSAQKTKDAKTKAEIEDLKRLVALFDQQQWGTGKEFNGIASSMSKETGVTISAQDVSQALKVALKSNILQRKKGKSILGYMGVKQVLTLLIICEQFQKNERFRRRFTKVENTSTSQSMRAFSYTFHRLKKSKSSELHKVLEQKSLSSLPANYFDTFVYDEKGNMREIADLKSSLISALNLMIALTAIPPIKNKKDEGSAIKILGFQTKPKKDLVKKRYKKLAMERHPDKFKSLKLPNALEKTITDNFATLQQAYDILMLDE